MVHNFNIILNKYDSEYVLFKMTTDHVKTSMNGWRNQKAQ